MVGSILTQDNYLKVNSPTFQELEKSRAGDASDYIAEVLAGEMKYGFLIQGGEGKCGSKLHLFRAALCSLRAFDPSAYWSGRVMDVMPLVPVRATGALHYVLALSLGMSRFEIITRC